MKRENYLMYGTFRHLLRTLPLAALVVGLQLLPVNRAAACRDCPFPSPLASLHWLMPGGNSEVIVEEKFLDHGEVESIVRLIDASTREILAIGRIEHLRGRKHLVLELIDKDGGKIKANLFYLDSKREKVQIRLECNKRRQCHVDNLFLS